MPSNPSERPSSSSPPPAPHTYAAGIPVPPFWPAKATMNHVAGLPPPPVVAVDRDAAVALPAAGAPGEDEVLDGGPGRGAVDLVYLNDDGNSAIDIDDLVYVVLRFGQSRV